MTTDFAKKALYGTPKVGGDALSYCTKCKMELAHVIVSMLDSQPAKVICKTCKSEHKFRKAPGARASKSSSTRLSKPSTATQVVRAAEYWEQKMREAKKVGRPYAISDTFQVGDVVEHSKFGPGIVETVVSPGKVTVFFRDGEKTLVHGMQKPA
jgi:hypothetical protein